MIEKALCAKYSHFSFTITPKFDRGQFLEAESIIILSQASQIPSCSKSTSTLWDICPRYLCERSRTHSLIVNTVLLVCSNYIGSFPHTAVVKSLCDQVLDLHVSFF
jgi:hypothetical protein